MEDVLQSIMNEEVIGLLDFGSQNITMAAVKINTKENSFNILSIAKKSIKAYNDADEVEHLLAMIVDDIEKKTNTKIEKILMAINSRYTQNYHITVSSDIKHNTVINLQHIIDIEKAAIKKIETANNNISILNINYSNYTIDKMLKVKNPIGCHASSIDFEISSMVTKQNIAQNLNKKISNYHLSVIRYINSCEAALRSCDVYNKEQEIMLCINIGATETSFIIKRENITLYSDFINLSGFDITQEISKKFCIPFLDAEKIKLTAENINNQTDLTAHAITQNGDHVEINLNELNSIIKKGLIKIFSAIKGKIQQHSNALEEITSITITGGVANTIGIEEVCKNEVFHLPTKVGVPRSLGYDYESGNLASYCTCIGMADILCDKLKEEKERYQNFWQTFFEKMLNKITRAFS